MIVKNLTRGTVISSNLKEAKTLPDKVLGLIKEDNPRSLMFKTRFGIHTFLLKEPIDVLILDDNGRVAKASTVKPNRVFLYNPKHQIVIEMPNGTINKTGTKIGDMIKLLP